MNEWMNNLLVGVVEMFLFMELYLVRSLIENLGRRSQWCM